MIIGIHQIEANLLNPKIMGDAAKIHPVLVIFSLLFGEHFFQVPGALLAVPVMSITQSAFLHFKDVIDREPAETRRRPRHSGGARVRLQRKFALQVVEACRTAPLQIASDDQGLPRLGKTVDPVIPFVALEPLLLVRTCMIFRQRGPVCHSRWIGPRTRSPESPLPGDSKMNLASLSNTSP